jgi:type III pantothenate kinase
MPLPTPFPLVAVDVGNSRMKLGRFENPPAGPLPQPDESVAVPLDASPETMIGWLPRAAREYAWTIASVNRPPTTRLVEALAARGVDATRLLSHADLPLIINLPQPEKVGMDRLCSALAARQLRLKQGPAVVISVGSAITVDLLAADGSFAGGAILPSLEMSARALDDFTDRLPLVTVSEPAAPCGKSTIEAIQFGLYWGAIGAIHELVSRLDPGGTAEIFMTGGGAAILATHLRFADGAGPRLVPHLTLAGIALAARGPTASRAP